MLAGSAGFLLASYALGRCCCPCLPRDTGCCPGATGGDWELGRGRQARGSDAQELLAGYSVLTQLPTCPGVPQVPVGGSVPLQTSWGPRCASWTACAVRGAGRRPAICSTGSSSPTWR